jgi:hypothetical protein
MKLLLSFLIVSFANGFMVQPPSVAPRTSTIVYDSRKRQKIASRTKWLENRGGMAEGGAAVADAAGLMTNADGLEYVKLVHPDTGASSEVYVYGGCVTSYKDGEGQEVRQRFCTKKKKKKAMLSSYISSFLAFFHCFSTLLSDPTPRWMDPRYERQIHIICF